MHQDGARRTLELSPYFDVGPQESSPAAPRGATTPTEAGVLVDLKEEMAARLMRLPADAVCDVVESR